ncbi:zinc-ribbon domain-containing protein [Arthrobacter sp. 2RAF6]|uniref:zinc-ribbon domain-containing protein n=1 Tax=Arthrobacter sp. 2RAF6 TaxID=3233002 RepID=UPI003F930DA7
MRPDQAGRLPLLLVPEPVPGETVPSYASRIDAATAAPAGHLWRLAVAKYLQGEGLPTGGHVDNDVAEQAVLVLCRELAGSRADQLALLGRPMRTAWHACLFCTAGEVIAIHPEAAQLVCPLHQTWTGPTMGKSRQLFWVMTQPAPTHSQPVDGEIAKAAARILLSGANPLIVNEAFRRAASAVGHKSDGMIVPGYLPTAAAILETVTNAEAVRAVCDAHRPYGSAYDVVAHRMEQASNPSADAGTDQAWLMLRWTAAAARYRWEGELNAEEPLPLVDPIQPESRTRGPLQPFRSYLDCVRTSGRRDDQWWDDRYRQIEPGPLYMCPEGHVQRRRPHKDHWHGLYQSSCSICSGRTIIPGYNSLADKMPWLVDEWDREAGPGPSPWTVGPGSGQMGHWVCPQNHHYDAIFSNRARLGSGCPHCGFRKLLPGTNDLASTHPRLALLWDPDAGNEKSPRELSPGNSRDRIVWRCPRGHPFVRTPASLVASGGRCQICRGYILLPGINDLATLRPDVATQWNYDRNGTLRPDQVKPGSTKVVWWVCPNGHEFPASVISRCKYPILTCRVETGRILVPGVSDLATREPRLVRDWDYDLNERQPDEMVPGNAKHYWTCPAGHTQYVTVSNRRRAGGCTRCPPGMRAIPKTMKNHLRAWDGE